MSTVFYKKFWLHYTNIKYTMFKKLKEGKAVRFGYCGINYKRANQDIRDKVSFTDSKKEEMFRLLEERGIYQSMVLSTCNRSEVFYFFQEEGQRAAASECFEVISGNVLDTYLEQSFEGEAVKYLFRVAAGLESMVLGEDQILGQVKEALEFSRAMGYCKKELNRVVTDAIACAKKIKTQYKISEIPLSVGYVGVKELDRQCPIKGKRVLLIGGGQTAGLALKYINEYSPAYITVCNRTFEKAQNLIKNNLTADTVNVKIRNLADRYEIMRHCDIVISATSSPHLVIEAEKCYIDRNIYMLDLAAPRDIDTSLTNNPFCTLINIDMLGAVVESNKKERKELSEKAASTIEAYGEETMTWLRLTAVDGTIESLQNRCDDIVRDSFSYINRKLSLSEHEQKVIERTLKASLKRLVREPIAELKSFETKEEQELFKKAVEKLFHI